MNLLLPRIERMLPCVPASGRDLVRLMQQIGVNSSLPNFAGA